VAEISAAVGRGVPPADAVALGEETKKDGRLEGRTTAGGSSARLDGSQGKLKVEKTREALRVRFAQEKQFGGPFREPVRKR
jgi:hypothetical protein